MDTMVLIGLGVAALGYVLYIVWRGISGKTVCDCGGACRDKNGSCQCGSKDLYK